MGSLRSHAGSLDEALISDDFVQDPYPVLARLRAEDRVHWLEPWRIWLVSSYRDVQEVLRLDGTLYSAVGQTSAVVAHLPPARRAELGTLERLFSAGLLWSDPPDHTRIRSVVNKALPPRIADAMRPRIYQIVEEALDEIDPNAPFDVVGQFAELVPVMVLAELLGIPQPDVPRFRRWANSLAAFLGSPQPSWELATAAQATVLEARDFIERLAHERRRHPGEGVVSRLVGARDAGAALSDDEFHATVIVLLVGGHRTTTALIGNAMLALIEHPQAFDALRGGSIDPARAVEEFLRYDSPHQRTIRVAMDDTIIGDQRIRRGQAVALLVGAANRDEQQFADPDDLVLDRSPNRHLSLSAGIHFCIGAPLARMEGVAAVMGLLNKFPILEPLEDKPRWLDNHTLRTVTSLRLRANERPLARSRGERAELSR